MYRGRAGPPKSTPANVQCQKCLKRGHYSYECKATAQERPYVPRPSRTQQLLNPKLRPQLTNDTPDTLQKKSGVADAELAKKAAQRAKELEALAYDDVEREADRAREGGSRRQRSRSYDSASSVSSRSPSPPPRRPSISPERRRPASQERRRSASQERRRSPSPRMRSPSPRSERSYSASDVSRSPRSPSPASDRGHGRPQYRGSQAHSDRSPSPAGPPPRHEEEPQAHRPRAAARQDSYDDERSAGRQRERPRRDSRSPERGGRRGARPYRDRRDAYDERDERRGPSPPREREPARKEPPRERSLSPFSRRLALTQAMNGRG